MRSWLAMAFASVAIIFASICFAQSESKNKAGSQGNDASNVSNVEEPKREFRTINLSPDGKFLIFIELDQKIPDKTRLLKLDLTASVLEYYDLPSGYVYFDPNLSRDGQKIVMRRNRDAAEEAAQYESLNSPELVTINVDGSQFKTYKLSSGDIFQPTFSNDGSKIAFWRANFLPKGASRVVARTDLWEYDLRSGKERLFAGPFDFFQSGQIQYLPGDDEVLVEADLPRKFSWNAAAYYKRFNKSTVFRMSRSQPEPGDPQFTDVSSARLVSLDKKSNIYYQAQQDGINLFKKTTDGSIVKWRVPHEFEIMYSTSVSPRGDIIAFIYSIPITSLHDRRFEIGILDTNSVRWRSIAVPLLDSSKPIHVGLADVGATLSH